MLFRKLIATTIGIIGFTAMDETPVRATRPAAYLTQKESGAARAEAVVYIAPDNRSVYIPVTGKNNLNIQAAKFIDNPSAALRNSERQVNSLPSEIVPREQRLTSAYQALAPWLEQVAESWGNPRTAPPRRLEVA